MPPIKRNKLKLRSLAFISAVDRPAQSHAVATITKRDAGDEVVATFTYAKASDDELGVIFGWALTSTVGGEPHYDLQGDAIDEDDLVKVAADYAAQGGAVDEMHDEDPSAGKALFLFPMTQEIATAFGIDTPKTGLLCGIKVAPDVLAKFKSGEYSGWSIGGVGDRTPVEKSAPVDDRWERLAKRQERSMAAATALVARDFKEVDRILNTENQEHDMIEIEKTDTIIKAAQVAVTKAQAEYDALVAKAASAANVTTTTALAILARDNTAAWREAYSKLADAQDDLDNAKTTAALGPIQDEIDKLEGQHAKAIEDFSIAHNMDAVAAGTRLSEISPTHRALEQKMSDTYVRRDAARDATKRAAEEAQFGYAKREYQKQLDAEAADIAALETPATKALREHVERLAAKHNVPYAKALLDATHPTSGDPVARELFDHASHSQAH